MQKKIVDFTNLLRKAGVRVSVAETLDSFLALDHMSLEDREHFKSALRCSMVKHSDDISTYDRLFDLYWSGFHDALREQMEQALGSLPGEVDLDGLMQRIQELLRNLPGVDLSELAIAMLTLDPNRLEQLIQQAAEESGVERIQNMLQIGFFSRRIIEQMGLDTAGGSLRDLLDRLREQGMSDQDLAQLEGLVRAMQDAVRKAVRQYTELELDKQNHDYLERFRQESLQEKSFYNLTQEDLRKMREVVERLAQKIKNIVSVRRKRERKGKFDLKHTLRRNMSRDGVPFELIFKHRRKTRPKLVVLCDISSSVSNVSRFMLQFIYSLQESFTKIRSFVFVAELGEVTQVFRDKDIYSAIDDALEGGGAINPYTRSNFGMAFHIFWREYLSILDNRTTVVVIGDARNNYNDPRAWCLREIRKKSKNLIWINPEAPGAWGFGDSVMDRYAVHCDVAEECRNLRQLARLVDHLVL